MIHVSEVAEWNAAAVADLARMAVLSDEPVIYHASVDLTAEQIAALEDKKREYAENVRNRM